MKKRRYNRPCKAQIWASQDEKILSSLRELRRELPRRVVSAGTQETQTTRSKTG